MWPLMTMLLWQPTQAEPAAASEESRYVDCSTVRTPQGIVIVDRIAFVFFDSDSAIITPQSVPILDNYVSTYDADPAQPHCQVVVWGNADRTGSARYNLQLSKLRADAVASYLRRKGLNAQIIVEALGEARPLVETPDGVAEPQNRVVGIYVRDPPARSN